MTSMLSLAIWPSMPWILRSAQDDKPGLKTLPNLFSSTPTLPLMSRRILLGLICLVTLWSTRLVAASAGPELGLQTWTCRNMTFDQVGAFADEHGLKKIEFIAAHLDPAAPPAESLRKKAVLTAHGLTAYSFGVGNKRPGRPLNPLTSTAWNWSDVLSCNRKS